MRSRNLLCLILVSTALAGIRPAQAAEPGPASSDSHQAYAGLVLGPSFVSDGLGTEFVYGARAGILLGDSFSLGIYGTHESLYSISLSSGGISASGSLTETVLAIEPEYYPLGRPLLYLGVKLGIGITSASASASGDATVSSGELSVRDSETDFAAGPAVGFNFPLGSNLSAGTELNAIFVQTPDNTLDLVNWLGTLTYWF